MKVKEKWNSESEQLYEWCMTFLDFLEIKTAAEYILPYREAVERIHATKNYKALKQSFSDLREWKKGLSDVMQTEFESLLGKKTVKAEKETEKEIFDQVMGIMKKGRIDSIAEYAIILTEVEQLYGDEQQSMKLDFLNNLLSEFHRKNQG